MIFKSIKMVNFFHFLLVKYTWSLLINFFHLLVKLYILWFGIENESYLHLSLNYKIEWWMVIHYMQSFVIFSDSTFIHFSSTKVMGPTTKLSYCIRLTIDKIVYFVTLNWTWGLPTSTPWLLYICIFVYTFEVIW